MSITITTDTVAEAVEVLTALTGQQPQPIPGAAPTVPPWSGLAATEDPAEDIDLKATADSLAAADGEKPPRCRKWKDEEARRAYRWVNDGLSMREVGDRLGRSASSVNNKIIAMEKHQRDLLHLKTPEDDR